MPGSPASRSNPFGGPGSVTVLRQNYGLEAFQRLQSDCATTFSYAAPLDFAAADIPLQGLKQYSYQALGQATLEDGLYAREADLAKPERVALFASFLGAARRGWQLAHLSPKAAPRPAAGQSEIRLGRPGRAAAGDRRGR